MIEKELFEIALKYIEKGYDTEDLRYGDDLYSAKKEEIDICLDNYWLIKEKGTDWAYEHLKTL